MPCGNPWIPVTATEFNVAVMPDPGSTTLTGKKNVMTASYGSPAMPPGKSSGQIVGNPSTDVHPGSGTHTPHCPQLIAAHSTPHPKIIHCCILPKFDNFSLNPKSLHNKKGPPEGSPFHRGIRSQSVHHHQLGVDDLDS
jgi:hypothetical protein